MLASTKHLFILSACLLPLLTQCGDGGKTTEELYTDKRPNDFVKVSAADIVALSNGDLITLSSTTSLVEVTMISSNTANVGRTAGGTTTQSFTSANVTWTQGVNAQATLILAATDGRNTLAENVTIQFDLNKAERDVPKTGTKANVPGKIIATTTPPNRVLQINGDVLLQIPIPNQS